MVHRLTLMKRQIAVAAINRAARGIHQVLSAMVTAAFQDVAKPHQIALDVSRRVLQGVPNTGLGRKIHHHLGPFFSKQRHQSLFILQSQALKAPGTGRRHGFNLMQPRLLKAGIVVVVQIVEANNPITALQQPDRQSCTDEASSTGHQNRSRHQLSPSPTHQKVSPAALTCS